MASISEFKYAHYEGPGVLSYQPNGELILTGGAEGDVRYCKSFEEDITSHCVGDEVIALACGPVKFYVASTPKSNELRAYEIKEAQAEGVITTFSAEITCIDVSSDGKLVASGSGDMTIEVKDTSSFKKVVCKGHSAPVLSIAIDRCEKRDYILSSSCDGNVCIWNLETGDIITTLSLLPKSNDITTSLTKAQVVWHPEGKFFAVPLKESIKLFTRETWSEKIDLKPENDLSKDEYYSSLAWSPDGRYVVSATTKGNITIWKAKEGTVIASLKSGRDYAISDIAWNPKGNNICLIDDHGFWGSITVSTEKISEPQKPVEKNNDLLNEDELASALFDDDDDDENENSFSIRQIKRETGFLSDEDSNMSNAELKKASITEKSIEDSKPMVPSAPQIIRQTVEFDPEIQEPFQPSSTPVNLDSRFMVWNNVGIVKQYNTEDENSIEVEFHDTSVHHPIHVSNTFNHIMADLSSESLVLACEIDDEKKLPSKLVCQHFASQGTSKDWTLEMPDKEDIMGICCGQGWVAAGTDKRRLRIFTVSGLQKDIISIPGPLVALAGFGQKLFVAIHLGMPLIGNQNIGYAVFDIGNNVHSSPNFLHLPLSPCSTLSWIGFSDEGTPCSMDSAGQLRLINSSYNAWIEVCDTKSLTKGKSDHYFVLGVSERELNVRSIFCKGSKFPLTVPKPTIVTLTMNIPLCGKGIEKTLLEEEYLKKDIQMRVKDSLDLDSVESIEKSQNEILIKLFALACKNDQNSRALDVCRLMNTATIQIAIKYATKLRKIQLANQLNVLACQVQEKEEEEEEIKNYHMGKYESQLSSTDMFDSNYSEEKTFEEEENPIIAAKRLKESSQRERAAIANAVAKDFRNPFKKSNGQTPKSSNNSPGLAFDEMTSSSQSKLGGFGAKKFNRSSNEPSPKTPKMGNLILKKSTNKENNDSPKPLRGFQLWMAENEEEFARNYKGLGDSEIKAKLLDQWKLLSKDIKDDYRTPRVPSKRKREDSSSDSLQSSNKIAKI